MPLVSELLCTPREWKVMFFELVGRSEVGNSSFHQLGGSSVAVCCGPQTDLIRYSGASAQ